MLEGGISLFSDSELTRINDILNNENSSAKITTYVYKKKTEAERERNKYQTLVKLESIRNKQKEYSLEEIHTLKIKELEKFQCLYFIHNKILNKFYIGKSEKVYSRICDHFRKGKGNSEVFEDYDSGFDFTISIISLKDSPFDDLDELEDNAIRAYNSMEPYGYNKAIGKIIDEDMFSLDEHKEISQLFIKKMKDDEEFYSYKKDNQLYFYISNFCRENNVVDNHRFKKTLMREIRKYRKLNKKISNKI
jgi:hypothetical protein